MIRRNERLFQQPPCPWLFLGQTLEPLVMGNPFPIADAIREEAIESVKEALPYWESSPGDFGMALGEQLLGRAFQSILTPLNKGLKEGFTRDTKVQLARGVAPYFAGHYANKWRASRAARRNVRTGRRKAPVSRRKGPRTTKTGIVRESARKYWRANKNRFDISQANRIRIKKRLSPKVDSQWIEYHPEHRAFVGEVIEKHHIKYGPITESLPKTLHRGPGYNKKNHPTLAEVE